MIVAKKFFLLFNSVGLILTDSIRLNHAVQLSFPRKFSLSSTYDFSFLFTRNIPQYCEMIRKLYLVKKCLKARCSKIVDQKSLEIAFS